ncbi:MAG: hypothetical protein QM627_05105 [Luteolibacter sp.]
MQPPSHPSGSNQFCGLTPEQLDRGTRETWGLTDENLRISPKSRPISRGGLEGKIRDALQEHTPRTAVFRLCLVCCLPFIAFDSIRETGNVAWGLGFSFGFTALLWVIGGIVRWWYGRILLGDLRALYWRKVSGALRVPDQSPGIISPALDTLGMLLSLWFAVAPILAITAVSLAVSYFGGVIMMVIALGLCCKFMLFGMIPDILRESTWKELRRQVLDVVATCHLPVPLGESKISSVWRRYNAMPAEKILIPVKPAQITITVTRSE